MTIGPSSQLNWASSLLSRLDQCALNLTTGGRDATGTNDEQLNSHVNQMTILRHKQVRKLRSL